MLRSKWILCPIMIYYVVSLSCKNDNPSSLEGGDSLVGTWNMILEKGEWDYHGSSDSEEYPYDEVMTVIRITESEMTSYTDYSAHPIDPGSNEPPCYDVSISFYSVSGNQLLGEEFNGSDTDEDGTFSWNTTFTIKGDELTIVWYYTYASGDWEKETIVLKRYSGAIPPPTWPTIECSTLRKKAVGRLLKLKKR